MAYFMSSLFISCHSWFFVAEMLLMWKYGISAFRILSQNLHSVFRSKLMSIWSSVELLLVTYFRQFHMYSQLQLPRRYSGDVISIFKPFFIEKKIVKLFVTAISKHRYIKKIHARNSRNTKYRKRTQKYIKLPKWIDYNIVDFLPYMNCWCWT